MAVLRGKDHVFELANDAFRERTGRRELIGKPIADAMPELRDQGFLEKLDHVFATGEPLVGKGAAAALSRRPGSPPETRYADFLFHPVFEADGTRSGVFIHGVDVTDATVAQHRLRAQFHGVPVPTYVWQRVVRDGEKDFILVDYNKAALTISRGGIAEGARDARDGLLRGRADDHRRPLAMPRRGHDDPARDGPEAEVDRRNEGAPRDVYLRAAGPGPRAHRGHHRPRDARATVPADAEAGSGRPPRGRGRARLQQFALRDSQLHPTSRSRSSRPTAAPLLRADLQENQGAPPTARPGSPGSSSRSAAQQVLEPRVIDQNESVHGMERLLGRVLGEDIELRVAAEGRARTPSSRDPGQIEQILMNLAVQRARRDAAQGSAHDRDRQRGARRRLRHRPTWASRPVATSAWP